jgi:ribonuclease PH
MNETSPTVRRPNGRAAAALRPLRIQPGAMKFAEGSVLIELGDTRILVAASIENRVPGFLKDSGRGWLTAEYSMLPRATHTRSPREVSQGKPSGRTAEIQRLIGRSLRAAFDLKALPDRTLALDCDVIQADGGTRTAAVTGAYVAATLACAQLLLTGDIQSWPIVDQIAAVSVGLVGGAPLLDLEYVEDQVAEVDMNVIGTAAGAVVEIQGTGEKRAFRREEMDVLVDLAFQGIQELVAAQNEVLAPTLEQVRQVLARGTRKPAPPKPEKNLWGRP